MKHVVVLKEAYYCFSIRKKIFLIRFEAKKNMINDVADSSDKIRLDLAVF